MPFWNQNILARTDKIMVGLYIVYHCVRRYRLIAINVTLKILKSCQNLESRSPVWNDIHGSLKVTGIYSKTAVSLSWIVWLIQRAIVVKKYKFSGPRYRGDFVENLHEHLVGLRGKLKWWQKSLMTFISRPCGRSGTLCLVMLHRASLVPSLVRGWITATLCNRACQTLISKGYRECRMLLYELFAKLHDINITQPTFLRISIGYLCVAELTTR